MIKTVKQLVFKYQPINFPGTTETVIIYPENWLFGAWVECGKEDEDLKELYESREQKNE